MSKIATPERKAIRYGDFVHFEEGQYKGLEAKVLQVDPERNFARVELLLIGAWRPIEVNLAELKRVPQEAEFRKPPDWIQDGFQELSKICERCQVQRLELFGSAATGKFDAAHSDLDFIVLFKPRSLDDPRVYYFDLKESLERLFHRAVDLVDETAMDNPFFMATVEPARILLYAA